MPKNVASDADNIKHIPGWLLKLLNSLLEGNIEKYNVEKELIKGTFSKLVTMHNIKEEELFDENTFQLKFKSINSANDFVFNLGVVINQTESKLNKPKTRIERIPEVKQLVFIYHKIFPRMAAGIVIVPDSVENFEDVPKYGEDRGEPKRLDYEEDGDEDEDEEDEDEEEGGGAAGGAVPVVFIF
jgi:hypothetical protein